MSIDLLDTAKGRYTYKNNSRCQIVYAKGKVLLFYLLGILIFFFADNAMLAVGCEDGHIHIFYVHDEGQIYRKNNIILRVSTYISLN